jgi:hypothetical protein
MAVFCLFRACSLASVMMALGGAEAMECGRMKERGFFQRRLCYSRYSQQLLELGSVIEGRADKEKREMTDTEGQTTSRMRWQVVRR